LYAGFVLDLLLLVTVTVYNVLPNRKRRVSNRNRWGALWIALNHIIPTMQLLWLLQEIPFTLQLLWLPN